MTERRAVLLVTVCRRYHELEANLKETRRLALEELGYAPDVVVVWARPELGRLWLFERLQSSGEITHVIGRPATDGEGENLPTTRPESLNIREGLEFVRANYPGHYVIMQAADVCPRPGTLNFFREHMRECEAVLYHWENGCCRAGVWHTNCFAVGLDERYGPPVSPPGEDDVLERQWGKKLEAAQLPGIHTWHNYNSRKFSHEHLSENLPPYPVFPRKGEDNLPLSIRGHKTIADRLLGVFRFCLKEFKRWLRLS